MRHQNMEAARANAGAQGNAGINTRNITPVDRIPSSFPWHETTQAIQRYQCAFSVNDITDEGTNTGVNTFTVRMNSPKDILTGNIALVDQEDWKLPLQGISTQCIGRYARNYVGTEAAVTKTYHRDIFDHTLKPTLASAYPKMYEYYKELYSAYAVIKVDWSMVISYPFHAIASVQTISSGSAPSQLSPQYSGNGRDTMDNKAVKVFAHYTVTGDSIAATENMPNTKSVYEMETFRGFDTTTEVGPNGTTTIKGTWYPGKVKHKVLNESDIDVWTATDTLPTSGHCEWLNFQYKLAQWSNNTGDAYPCVNCKFNAYYTVQYKDLKQSITWPTAADDPIEVDVVHYQQQYAPTI
jgi:hypothetical protein